MRNKQGFTLIEILIVVAVIAILAAIALPAYNNYVNRAKIKTAQADLIALGLNIENQYQRTLAYPTANVTSTADLVAAYPGWTPASENGDFAFSTTGSSATSYTLQATGAGGVNGCTVSLTNTGTRSINNTCQYGDGDWL